MARKKGKEKPLVYRERLFTQPSVQRDIITYTADLTLYGGFFPLCVGLMLISLVHTPHPAWFSYKPFLVCNPFILKM